MELIFISHVLKKVTYYSDVATGPLQGLLGCENMMILDDMILDDKKTKNIKKHHFHMKNGRITTSPI